MQLHPAEQLALDAARARDSQLRAQPDRRRRHGIVHTPPEIARFAHSLRSSSANVGAEVLSRYCGDIEASAHRADTEEARKIFAMIEAEHGRVQAALTAEFETLAVSKA